MKSGLDTQFCRMMGTISYEKPVTSEACLQTTLSNGYGICNITYHPGMPYYRVKTPLARKRRCIWSVSPTLARPVPTIWGAALKAGFVDS